MHVSTAPSLQAACLASCTAHALPNCNCCCSTSAEHAHHNHTTIIVQTRTSNCTCQTRPVCRAGGNCQEVCQCYAEKLTHESSNEPHEGTCCHSCGSLLPLAGVQDCYETGRMAMAFARFVCMYYVCIMYNMPKCILHFNCLLLVALAYECRYACLWS